MRFLHTLIATCLLACTLASPAAENPQVAAKAAAAQGIAFMEQDKLIDAAIAFAQAMSLYEEAKDTDGQVDMQANIFWCKKKMNVDDLMAYRRRVEAGDVPGHTAAAGAPPAQRQQQIQAAKAALAKIEEVANRTVSADEAQSYFNKAEAYARSNSDKTLLIAARWYEVAERFRDHPLGQQAQGKLLDVQRRLNDELEKKSQAIAQQQKAIDEMRDGYFGRKAAAPGAEPIPDTAAQRKALTDIKAIYAADYKSTKPDDKRDLAMSLFKAQEKSKNEPTMRWVMLTEAIRLGVESEHYWVILRAHDAQGAIFAGVDVDKEKRAALKKMGGKPAAAQVAKLLDDPKDAAANAVVGRFFCASGEWKDGLQMLALGADETLKRVANMELAGAKSTDESVMISDAWYDAGKAAKVAAERAAFYDRARTGYQKALKAKDAPTGITRSRVDKNLAEIDKIAPPPITDWSKITQNQWDALKGVQLAIEARKARTDPGIVVSASYPVRIVPAPKDTWQVGPSSGSQYTTDWKGTSKYWSRGGFNYGELIIWVDKDKVRHHCFDTIAADGRLLFAPNYSHNDNWWDGGATGQGAIRVKIVPVAD
jgi:hypothetical protein